MATQLQIPLFPEDMMSKIKTAHALQELVKLQKEIEHLKHSRAGHIGAFNKLKKSQWGVNQNSTSTK